MSRHGANVFVTVGTPDYWDVTAKAANIVIDSSLRRAANLEATVQLVGGVKTITIGATPVYAEFRIRVPSVDSAHIQVGIVAEDEDAHSATGLNLITAASINGEGTIYQPDSAGSEATSALATGDRIGIKAQLSGGDVLVQFSRNGEEIGNAVTLPAGTYRLAAYLRATDAEATMCADANDMVYRPLDCQAWGAAARVADAGGYSPRATDFGDPSNANGEVTYGRILVSDGALVSASAKDSVRTRRGDRLVYFAFVHEDDNSAAGSCTAGFTLRGGVSSTMTIDVGDESGFVWNPETGDVWALVDGVPLAGDPEAGTGATFTGKTGDLVPYATVNGGSRVRMLTHKNEFNFMPSYAEPWDGADLLPDRHHKGTLGNDPYVRQRMWLPQWGGSPIRDAPMGALEIINASGEYDYAGAWALRDQELNAYETDANEDGYPAYIAKGFIDRVEVRSDNVLRVLLRNTLALLEQRVDSEVFVLGACRNVPLKKAGWTSASDVYIFGQGNECNIDVFYDQGDVVTTWRYDEQTIPNVAVRTVNIIGVQTAFVVANNAYTDITSSLTNADFSAWTGDNPDSWTVTNEGANSSVSEGVSGGARFVHVAGNTQVSLFQDWPIGSAYMIEVDVSAYVEGDIMAVNGSNEYPFGITGTGTFRANGAYGVSEVTLKPLDEDTDLTISAIRVYRRDKNTGSADDAVTYVMTKCGVPASAYDVTGATGFNSALGYFSDQQPTYREALEEFLADAMVDCYVRSDGVMVFIRPATAPESATPEVELEERDFLSLIEVTDDTAPELSDSIMVDYNWRVMTEDEVATAATRRSSFLRQYDVLRLGEAPNDYGDLDPYYEHAIGAPPMRRRVYTWASSVWADDDLDFIQSMWAVKRCFYTGRVKIAKARQLRPWQAVTVTHPRHGLSDGVTMYVVGLERTLSGASCEVMLWGPGALPSAVLRAPHAAFSAREDSPAVVDFDGTNSRAGSYQNGGTITGYAWNFGDGSTGVGATPQHTYASAGTYTVLLTVTDSDGRTASTWKRVEVVAGSGNVAPTALFTIDDTADPQIDVDGTGSTDSDGTIVSWSWDWDDGTANGSGSTASHTYTANGSYTITLTVTDNDGATDTYMLPVTVSGVAGNAAPTASFTIDDSADPLIAVDGTGSTDSDGTIASYDWDWDDGTAHGSGSTANHTYTANGTYDILLTVTDDDGATDTHTLPVTVAGVGGGGGGTDTFMRILFDETWGAPQVQIAEVNFVNGSAAEVTGTTTSSSDASAATTAAEAVDSDNDTYWQPTLSDSEPALMREFASASALDSVTQVKIRYANIAPDVYESAPLSFRIQTSATGTGGWTTVKTVTGEAIWTEGEQRTYTL